MIDDKWKDHLYDLDHLKQSITFRGWGQKDPLIEYKQEAFDMFVDLMTALRKSVAQFFFRVQFGPPQPQPRAPQRLVFSGPQETATAGGPVGPAARLQPLRRQSQPQPAAAPAGVDEFGVARSAQAGPDPRTLATNRGGDEEQKQQPVHVEKEPGRNDPCPCGSGKKYKKCHGR